MKLICVLQAKAEAIKLEELKIKEEKKEIEEAEREKQLREAKKQEQDKPAPISVLDEVLVDTAPVIEVDTPKQKSEEGLSSTDIDVIEDALEKLGELLVTIPWIRTLLLILLRNEL